MVANTGPVPATRVAALDALRGGAILAMVVFHLGWDLTAFGMIDPAVTAAPGWTLFGRVVTVTFLGLVGFNLTLATRHGLRPARFLRRLAVIGAAAGAVSLGTWVFDPGTFVFFGILHCIALGSVLALPFLRAPGWLVATAATAALAAPRLAGGDAFPGAAWHWLGLAADVPAAVDYVPILPWFGFILLGLLAGHLGLTWQDRAPWHWQPRNPFARALAACGRWSLAIYLVHQPILVGLLMLAAPLASADQAPPEALLRGKLVATCVASGQPEAACGEVAACVLARVGASPPRRREAEPAVAWDEALAACAAAGAAPPAR